MPSTIKVLLGGREVTDNWLYDGATNSVIFSDVSGITGEEELQISYDYVDDCN